MKHLVSGIEFIERARSGRFWLRTLAAYLVGYVFAALGWSAVFIFLLVAYGLITEFNLESLGTVAVSPLALPMFLMIPMILMLPLTIVTLPIFVALAILLRTSERNTTIVCGALGLIVGWPVVVAHYGLPMSEWWAPFSHFAAGAGYGLALWWICLRYYVAGHGME